MNIFVLFGITGDLAKYKIVPALDSLAKDSSIFIGVGRKPEPIPEFEQLNNHIYISGDLMAIKVYKQIANTIDKKIKGFQKGYKSIGGTKLKVNIIMYSAMPPSLHAEVANGFALASEKLFAKIKKNNRIILETKILVEKPLGNSLKEAQKTIEQFSKIKKLGFDINYVDHYLAKEPLLNLEMLFASNPDLVLELFPLAEIREIKAVLYEKEGIRDRGIFYDKIGALYDVGQNHLLQVIATMAIFVLSGNQKGQKNAKSKLDKIQILKQFQIHGLPIFWQYHGYTGEKDVAKDSNTETFFKASFRLRNIDTIFTISSGKMLDMEKSGIEVHFKDNRKSLFIDFNGSLKDAYEIIFESVINGQNIKNHANSKNSSSMKKFSNIYKIFASSDEIIESWKIVERLKKLKTKSNIIVYKKLHDIIG